MGGKLVGSLLSDSGGGGEELLPPKSYKEIFNDLFPQYLAIGMTEEQYWDKDCTLTVAYRKADEIRRERLNQELWLQGVYIYEALIDVSPILHAFAKRGTKPLPYSEKPYPLTFEQVEKQDIKKDKKIYEKGKAYMTAVMSNINKKER